MTPSSQSPRRIAFVLTQDGGGPVDVTVGLARHLAEQPGHQVRLFGPRPARNAGWVEDILVERQVPSKTDVKAMAALRRDILDFAPDVVHAQDRRSGLLCAGLGRTLRAGRPAVVHTYHGVPDDVTQEWLLRGDGERPSRYTLATLAADAAVARAVDHTVVVAEVMGDFLRRTLKVPAARVSHISNGLFLPPVTVPTGTSRLLFVGSLIERKGVEDLVAAMAIAREERPDLHLRVVGDGPQRPALEAQVARLGLADHVELLGFRSDVPDLLAEADVFVLPARMEQQPLVLIEALAAGKLVVATDAGGVVDMVRGLDSGTRVVPARDPRALAAALVDIAGCDDVASASVANTERARAEFSVEECARRHLDLYSAVLRRVRGSSS